MRRRRHPIAAERGRQRRVRLATCWYGLLGVLMVLVFAALALTLSGQLPVRLTIDVLRLGGLGLAGLGLALQAGLDYFGGSKDGDMFIRFTETGWRLGAPLWVVGLSAFAAGSLLAQR